MALHSQLAILTGAARSADNDIAQLRFALSITNESTVSRAVLCSQALGVASDAVSLAEEALLVIESKGSCTHGSGAAWFLPHRGP